MSVPIEDATPEVPKPSRLTKVKRFVKDHDVELAFAAGGIFVFGATYRFLGVEIDQRELALRRLRGEFYELYDESGLQMEFIDHKNLREKYFAFAKEQRELAEKAT